MLTINELIRNKPILGHITKHHKGRMPFGRESVLIAAQEGAMSYYYSGIRTTMNCITRHLDGFDTSYAEDGYAVRMNSLHCTSISFTAQFDPVLAYRTLKRVAPTMCPDLYGMAIGADSSNFAATAIIDGIMYGDINDLPKYAKKNKVVPAVMDTIQLVGLDPKAFLKQWTKRSAREEFTVKQKRAGLRMFNDVLASQQAMSKEGWILDPNGYSVKMLLCRNKLKLIFNLATVQTVVHRTGPFSAGSDTKVYFNEWIDFQHDRMYCSVTPMMYMGDTNIDIKYAVLKLPDASNAGTYLNLPRKIVTAYRATGGYARLDDVNRDYARDCVENSNDMYLERYEFMKSIVVMG